MAYRVTGAGIEWIEGVRPPPVAPGSVVDMIINNYQAYAGQGGEEVPVAQGAREGWW